MKRRKLKKIIEVSSPVWVEINNYFLKNNLRGIWSYVGFESTMTNNLNEKCIRLEIKDNKFIKIISENKFSYIRIT